MRQFYQKIMYSCGISVLGLIKKVILFGLSKEKVKKQFIIAFQAIGRAIIIGVEVQGLITIKRVML